LHPAIEGLAKKTFLREFAFLSNEFELDRGKTKELADVFLILRDQAVAIEHKGRQKGSMGTVEEERKWFSNKILNVAKKQSKNSYRFLTKLGSIAIQNLAGRKVPVQTTGVRRIHLVILYDNDRLRYGQEQYYRSREAGLIHILNVHDWLYCLHFLYTPREVMGYLAFREAVVEELEEHRVSEHEIFAAYILEFDPPDLLRKREEVQKKMETVVFEEIPDFDYIVGTYGQKEYTGAKPEDYYEILSELAELNRPNRKLFLERWVWCADLAERLERGTMAKPGRFKTSWGVGFMFLPVAAGGRDEVIEPLVHRSLLSKYDLRVQRHLGIAMWWRGKRMYVEWCYRERPWKRDPKVDAYLKEDSPFRPLREALVPEYPLGPERPAHGHRPGPPTTE